jgi:hypothetical protein
VPFFWQNCQSIFGNNLAWKHRRAKILVYLESSDPKEHNPVVGTFWPEEISKVGFFGGTIFLARCGTLEK